MKKTLTQCIKYQLLCCEILHVLNNSVIVVCCIIVGMSEWSCDGHECNTNLCLNDVTYPTTTCTDCFSPGLVFLLKMKTTAAKSFGWCLVAQIKMVIKIQSHSHLLVLVIMWINYQLNTWSRKSLLDLRCILGCCSLDGEIKNHHAV